MLTLYEYIQYTQPKTLLLLKSKGLLQEQPPVQKRLTFGEIISLMRHDRWKRVRGAVRQVFPATAAR
ncbi:MAG: hypothetical protein JL50_08400 [Peptococcaceae bacterium BICA1-7]|nr:MAG: hypothetical protein JL50_08400 [Peptococcaceae bacterium BICA1-7]HBV97418.1 hypothetical protein [Desulfotomaculum sp.]